MMRSIRGLVFAAVVLTNISGKGPFAADLAAKEGGQLTLGQAQALALRNHPLIASQGFRAQASGETVNEAKSNLYPQVYGSAARVFAGSNTRVTAPPGAINNPTVLAHGSAGIAVSQLITDFGRQSDLIASSELSLRSEEDRVQSTHDTVLFGATAAYYNVLRSQAQLKVALETVKSRSTLYDQISRLRGAKLKSDLDVSFAKLGLDQANLLQIRAEGNLNDAWAKLAEAMGSSSVQHYALTDPEAVTPPLETLDAALALALSRNPDLLALEASRDAAHKQAEADSEAGYPVVAAQGYAGTNPVREPAQKLSSNYGAAGITITIPIFTGGRLTAQERRSALAATALDRDVDAARNLLSRDVQIAWDTTQTAYRNIAVTAQLLESSAQALNLMQARYNIGLSSIVELEQAQVNALQAEIEQGNATYDYLTEHAFLAYREGGDAGPPQP